MQKDKNPFYTKSSWIKKAENIEVVSLMHCRVKKQKKVNNAQYESMKQGLAAKEVK
jgi:hypothetical protein